MNKFSLSLMVITLGFSVAGCAKTPSKIAPMAVSSSEYDGLSCNALLVEQKAVEAKLEEATKKQKAAVASDAATVFLVLIPVSALAGDSEADVARFKGESLAIDRAISRKQCG